MTVAEAIEWMVEHNRHGRMWVHDKDLFHQQHAGGWHLILTDNAIWGHQKLSPPSTMAISLSISDSDSRFCLIAGGTITSVSRFFCFRNFFLERLLRQCHTFFLCTGSLMYATEAACVLIDDGRVDFPNTWTHEGGQRDRSTRPCQLSPSLKWL